MLELGLKIFISYIVGSVNGALIVGRLYGGVDIRKVGSGNAGGTNALRTQGKAFAAFVMLVDIAKGVLPVLILPSLAVPWVGIDAAVSREWLVYGCGGAAIFGHCYPLWHEFRGGKGAATTLGVAAAALPILLLPMATAWFGGLFIFGYVGLATVLAGFAMPVFVLLAYGTGEPDLLLFTTLISIFVLYTHRSNMRELFSGDADPDVSGRLIGRFRQT